LVPTQAIASYIRALIKLDPNLIILVSDHVPPLTRNDSYKDFRYLNTSTIART